MKTTNGQHPESVRVNEEFITVDTRFMDAKHRITLSGKVMKGSVLKTKKIDSYQILVCKNGDILLRPAVSIPAREAWIYENPKVTGMICKGLNEAKQGKVQKVHDLDGFLDNLWISTWALRLPLKNPFAVK